MKNVADWFAGLSRNGKIIALGAAVGFVALIIYGIYYVQAKGANIQSYVESVETAESGMTLWQTIQAGGWVMAVLGVLSVISVTLICYLFLRLNPNQQVPIEFTHGVLADLRKFNYRKAKESCAADDNLASQVIAAGLDKIDHDPDGAKETVELTARKEISSLWQQIGYLSDIAAVAPMIGLLGTVLGMIQAFNTIAFETAVVKPILLAGGVSKAMVTTAGGMIIAIVAMIFYSLFRSRVQEITNRLEAVASEILGIFVQNKSKKAVHS